MTPALTRAACARGPVLLSTGAVCEKNVTTRRVVTGHASSGRRVMLRGRWAVQQARSVAFLDSALARGEDVRPAPPFAEGRTEASSLYGMALADLL
jgi:hypothetical protein